MNKVLLTGRMTANPNPVATSKNIPVTKFIVACNSNIPKGKVEFIPCTCFSQTATYANTYIKKGDYVVIEGRISRSKFTNMQGGTSYSTDVIVENINVVYGSTPNNNAFGIENQVTNTPTFPENVEEKQSIDDAFNEDNDANSLADANKKQQEDDDNSDLPPWMSDID